MKTCVIGNSHAGSLLKAYHRQDTDQDTGPGAAWDFFVASNGHAQGAGLRAIGFDEAARAFTGFPHATAGADGTLAIDAYDRFVLFGAHPSPADIAAALPVPASTGFRAAAIGALCRTAPLAPFAEILRRVTKAPVYLATKAAFPPTRHAPPPGIAEVADTIAAHWQGHGVTFVAQPAEMLDADGLTLPDHFLGDGNWHLRPASAALMLDAIGAALR